MVITLKKYKNRCNEKLVGFHLASSANIDESDISYDSYLKALELLDESYSNGLCSKNSSLIDEYLVLENVSKGIKDITSKVKKFVDLVVQETKLSANEVIDAFKSKEIFRILKAVSFNAAKLFTPISLVLDLKKLGVFAAVKALQEAGVLDKLRKGLLKVDDVLEQNPILKKIGALAIAGMLLLIWLSSSSFEDANLDLNFDTLIDALKGQYSIADVLGSPNLIMALIMFASGGVMSLAAMETAKWVNRKLPNLAVALAWTGARKKKLHVRILNALSQKIPRAILGQR